MVRTYDRWYFIFLYKKDIFLIVYVKEKRPYVVKHFQIVILSEGHSLACYQIPHCFGLTSANL